MGFVSQWGAWHRGGVVRGLFPWLVLSQNTGLKQGWCFGKGFILMEIWWVLSWNTGLKQGWYFCKGFILMEIWWVLSWNTGLKQVWCFGDGVILMKTWWVLSWNTDLEWGWYLVRGLFWWKCDGFCYETLAWNKGGVFSGVYFDGNMMDFVTKHWLEVGALFGEGLIFISIRI